MAALSITAEELDYLIDLKDQGRIAEAWNFLGEEKGDAYVKRSTLEMLKRLPPWICGELTRIRSILFVRDEI